MTLEYEDQETEIVYGDVTVPDELAKGKIRVKKTDAETGNGLSGAEFEIRAKEDIVTPDGTVKAKAGTVLIRSQQVIKEQPKRKNCILENTKFRKQKRRKDIC